MNVRKNIDYSKMYERLDLLMAKEQPQMDLYCGIGKVVCQRTEKGAAVMASEYLNKQYPDVKGFSPRSLRRMRDFYRTYENHPSLLSRDSECGDYGSGVDYGTAGVVHEGYKAVWLE